MLRPDKYDTVCIVKCKEILMPARPPSSAPARPATRGRPRSTTSRQAVMSAAYAILCESGLSAFSIDAVASRSGVARTTIYRSWPTKGLLAFDSFLEAVGAELAFGITDDPVEDFRALVQSLARTLSGPSGRVAASVMAEAQSDAELRNQFTSLFSQPLRTRSTQLIEAGIAAGAFRPDLDVARVIDAGVGAIYFRLLQGLSLDDRWSLALADTLLGGCIHGRDSH